jgi:hypothetical protein
LSYVIVSLAESPPCISSFIIKNDKVFPEGIEIIAGIEKSTMLTGIAS